LGGIGDDTLNGGAGADTIEGAAGNDVYVVDNAGDVIVEDLDKGRDTVRSSIDWALGANLENLVLLGSAVSGLGNELDNRITGNDNDNDLSGGEGNDTLNGGVGADALAGGVGDDLYLVDNEGDWIGEEFDQGHDTVRSSIDWTLYANLDDLVLLGSAVSGFGNELDNRITGNDNDNVLSGAEGNDTLNGGGGADTLSGGNGDDLYVVDNDYDVVELENPDEGHDTVRSSVWFSFAISGNSYLEDLVLVGSENIDGYGNEGANTIIGNIGDNTLGGFGGDDSLSSGQGNDYLDGGTGSDTMRGGTGDDVYVVDDAGDTVIEAADGGTSDFVFAFADCTLAANVENMHIYGGTHFVGNKGDNFIWNAGGTAISIDGGAGDDVLMSGGGSTLIGGAGNDRYIFTFRDEVVVEAAGGGDDTIETWYKQDIDLGSFANVENLVIGAGATTPGTTATGNALDNKISGNGFANVLYGLDGNDTLDGDYTDGGGAVGNDTLYGGNGDDWIEGSVGSDLLDGGAGEDTLVASYGADELTGGTGSDTFEIEMIHVLDRVTDFQVGANGDTLDLSDLLTGYDGVTSDANDFVRFTTTAGGTLVQVDADGAGGDAAFVDTVLLQGVNLTDVGQAIADGNLTMQ
jgi:Ca2+-binding RTX toxin-like protein